MGLPLAMGIIPCGLLAADPQFIAFVQNPFGIIDIGAEAHIDLVDIDGDFDLDAFVGRQTGQTGFFRNTGNPAAPAFAASVSAFGISDVGDYSTPAFGDIDGDGDYDAFVGEDDGSTRFFLNTGNTGSPTFASAVLNPFGITDIGSFAKPSLVDIDGDADLDLFVGEDLNELNFIRNTGNSTNPLFATASLSPFGIVAGTSHSALEFADVDGDGDLDLLLGVGGGDLRFQRNTGHSTNPAFGAVQINPFGLITAADDACPALVDIDADGDIDAFVGQENGITVYYQNTSILDTIAPTLNITRTDVVNTSESAVRFQLSFSEIVAPTFTLSDVQLTGTLASEAFLALPDATPYTTFDVFAIIRNDTANGTIGIRVNGAVTDSRGNVLVIPIDSALYTIANYPAGDVNKDGTLDLADVALLADANLRLATLP